MPHLSNAVRVLRTKGLNFLLYCRAAARSSEEGGIPGHPGWRSDVVEEAGWRKPSENTGCRQAEGEAKEGVTAEQERARVWGILARYVGREGTSYFKKST